MNDVDKQSSFMWLRQHLHSETELLIIAIQNQVIATRVIESKVMHNQCHLSCADCVTKLKKLSFIYCQPVLSLF